MIERNITRKAFPKMLVGLFVALFGDYGECERWNSNAHTSGFRRSDATNKTSSENQVVKTGWAGLIYSVDISE